MRRIVKARLPTASAEFSSRTTHGRAEADDSIRFSENGIAQLPVWNHHAAAEWIAPAKSLEFPL
jgi:hypothetical protein